MANIAELKKNHRIVFCSQVGSFSVFFRPLTLKERDTWRKIVMLGLLPLDKVYDQVFREIVLDEILIDEMNQTPAGLVPTIVETAFLLSGTDLQTQNDMERVNKDLADMRAGIENNVFEQFIVLICKAFPSITPSDVEDMDYRQVLRHTVMAESILELEHPIKLEPQQKKKSIGDKIFEDARKAKKIDEPINTGEDIRDILHQRQEAVSMQKQALQQERLRQIEKRRRKG